MYVSFLQYLHHKLAQLFDPLAKCFNNPTSYLSTNFPKFCKFSWKEKIRFHQKDWFFQPNLCCQRNFSSALDLLYFDQNQLSSAFIKSFRRFLMTRVSRCFFETKSLGDFHFLRFFFCRWRNVSGGIIIERRKVNISRTFRRPPSSPRLQKIDYL